MVFSSNKLTIIKLIFLLLLILFSISFVLYIKNHEEPFDYKEHVSNNIQNDVSISPPDNIIVFIIDGFGFNHLSLAQVLQEDKHNYIHNFKSGWHSNQAENRYLTDSAASATALSTGHKTINGAIGVDAKGSHLKNLIEIAIENGMKTGVVTDSYFWDATPAAFTAHVPDRRLSKNIIQQQASSDIDLLIGEIGRKSPFSQKEVNNIFSERFLISNLDSKLTATPTAILLPHEHFISQKDPTYFSKVAKFSIDFFEENYSERFLLILETEEVDTSSHKNDSARLISAINSINQTLILLSNYIMKNPDSLLIVTSDHETGGLSLVKAGETIKIKWASKKHTRSLVPILTMGKSADKLAIPTRNDKLGQLIQKLI